MTAFVRKPAEQPVLREDWHENEDGSITGNLLFKPIRIIAVRDVTLKIELKEGVHYKLDENDPTKVIWLPGDETFSIPYFKPGDLTSAHQDKCGTDGYGGILNGVMYCVGEWLYSKQISFTYTYDLNENEMPHAEFAGSKLPKTLAKLKGGEKVKIAFYGDSIFTGCDSSSTYGREPKAPTFFNMVKRQLSALYPDAKIKITNPSVGGWQAKHGLENVDSKVAAGKPDLVILGFGMNDSNVDGEDEAKTIQQMMDKILAKNPTASSSWCPPSMQIPRSAGISSRALTARPSRRLRRPAWRLWICMLPIPISLRENPSRIPPETMLTIPTTGLQECMPCRY